MPVGDDGSKYERTIRARKNPKESITVDIYCVLDAFPPTSLATEGGKAAIQHALKKLLAPGGRGKDSTLGDLEGAIVAIQRAIAFEKAALPDQAKPGTIFEFMANQPVEITMNAKMDPLVNGSPYQGFVIDDPIDLTTAKDKFPVVKPRSAIHNVPSTLRKDEWLELDKSIQVIADKRRVAAYCGLSMQELDEIIKRKQKANEKKKKGAAEKSPKSRRPQARPRS